MFSIGSRSVVFLTEILRFGLKNRYFSPGFYSSTNETTLASDPQTDAEASVTSLTHLSTA